MDLKNREEFIINACVHKLKMNKKFAFVYLRTSDEILETVYRKEICSDAFELLKEGCFIKASAFIKEQKRSKGGNEINLKSFTILSSPFNKSEISISDKDFALSVEEAMKNKVLAMRHPDIKRIYLIRGSIVSAFENFMNERGFISVTTPILTYKSERPSFMVNYFDTDAELTFSPQLYMSAATAAFEKVYEVSHSFLAKRFNSTRHLNEFTSLNFQIGYIDGLSDLEDIVTELIQYITNFLKQEYGIGDFRVNTIPSKTFDEALKILKKDNQSDLDPTDIKKLCQYSKANYNSDFIYVTDFPDGKRPFYINPGADNTLSCFDLYFSGMKIAAGSENISDYNLALNIMKKKNITPNKVYLDAIRYGIMPYGGVMIGLERLVVQLLSLSNVREAALFPRDLHHLTP